MRVQRAVNFSGRKCNSRSVPERCAGPRGGKVRALLNVSGARDRRWIPQRGKEPRTKGCRRKPRRPTAVPFGRLSVVETVRSRNRLKPMPHKQAPEGRAVPRGGKVRAHLDVSGARENGEQRMYRENWYNRYKKQPQESMPHKQAPEGSAIPRGGKVRAKPHVLRARKQVNARVSRTSEREGKRTRPPGGAAVIIVGAVGGLYPKTSRRQSAGSATRRGREPTVTTGRGVEVRLRSLRLR